MKRTFYRAACAALGLAVVLSACGGASASTSSSIAAASSEPRAASSLTETFRAYDQYDYANFNNSMSLDETGRWTGITATDFVTLPEDYAAISIPAADVTPSAEDLSSGIDAIVAQYAAAATGDTVNIDYVGTVGGVAFQGGNTYGQGASLLLGSGSYIDGFEDQIVGHKVGESFDITVTFPQGHNDSTDASGNPIVLSGTEAVFSITLNAIDFAWELTDDWVAQTLEADYNVSSVAELTAYETDQLTTMNKESYVVNYLLRQAVFADPLPESILDYMVCKYLSYYNDYAIQNSQTLEDFVTSQIHYASVDAMLADGETSIVSAVQRTLVYQAVAEMAGLSPSADTIADYADFVASNGQNYINQFALDRDVIRYLVEHSTTA